MKQKMVKFLSAFLSFVMVFTFLATIPITTYAAETTQTSEEVNTYQTVTSTLAPGITQDINSAYCADGSYLKYYVSVADLSNENVGLHTSYKDAQGVTPGMDKMTEQVEALKNLHSNPDDAENYIPNYAIVAGINGDGYIVATGQPTGVHYANGVVGFNKANPGTSKDSWFAIFEDGTALCGANKTDWDEAIAAHGQPKEAIGGFQLVMKNGVEYAPGSDMAGSTYLNESRYPRSFVGVTADNKVVFMVADGNYAGGSCGTNYAESLEIMKDYGCTYILCLDGGGSATYVSRPAGKTEVEVTNVPSDGAERAVSNGLVFYTTAPATDVFETAVLDTSYDYYTPNSTVTMASRGVSPAGTPAEVPADVEWTLSDDSFGTISNGVFVSNGKLGEVTLRMEYKNAVVGSKTIQIVNPDVVRFKEIATISAYGSVIPMEFVVTYNEYAVGFTANDFIWETTDEKAGTLSGLSYIATTDTSITDVKISATYKHSDVGTTEFTITFGRGSEILFDFEDGTIGGFMGTDEALKWNKDNNYNASADRTGFDGNGMYNNDMNVFVADKASGAPVKNGNYSLGVNVDYTHAEFKGWNYNYFFYVKPETAERIVLRDTANDNNATTVGMWIYVPEGFGSLESFAAQLLAGYRNEDGKDAPHAFWMHMLPSNAFWYGNTEEDYPETRWVYIYADISDYDYVFWDTNSAGSWAPAFMRVYCKPYEPSSFNLFFDDISLNYGTAVDDVVAPVISDLKYSSVDSSASFDVVSSRNDVMFTATVADYAENKVSGLDYSTAKIYVDGVALDNVTVSGSVISSDEVTLSNGTHLVTFEIADNSGHVTRETATLVISGEANVTLGGHNDLNNTPEAGSVYYVDINTADISVIDRITTTLAVDTCNTWEYEHLIVADGFEATATHDPYTNTVTVTVTRVGEVSETGAQTLCSIPVRLWSWNEDEAEASKKAQVWLEKYLPKLTIDSKVVVGEVVYTADSDYADQFGTFSGSISVETMVQHEANPWHEHTAEAIADLAATCTKAGYTGRTYCRGCGSVVDWGTTEEATGHTYEVVEGVLKCTCGERFNGEYTDGKTYVDGVVMANGWNGDSYWQDGVKLTGIQIIDGYYYDFGDDGVCAGQMKLTGLFYDETVSAWRYAKLGELQGGWVKNGDYWHYFNTTTKVAVTGVKYWGPVFTFDETGMTEGAWYKTSEGTRYYYGPDYYMARNNNQVTFIEIDGKTYNFDKSGYVTTGIHALYDDWASMMRGEMRVWEFDENGVLIGQITEKGVIDNKRDGLYLVEDDGFVHGGSADGHLTCYNGDYYFVLYSGKLLADASRWVSNSLSNGLLPAGTYYFGEDGKLFTGVKEGSDGALYYYKGGKVAAGLYNSELVTIDGSVYLVKWSGKVAADETRYISNSVSNGLLPAGTYYFGEDGKLFTGVKEDPDGVLYHYKDGKAATGLYNSELVEINDAIYLVKWSGKVAADETRYVSNSVSNGLLPAGTYYFGEDGKLFTGIKEGSDGALYYYEDGKVAAGLYNSELVEINNAIYLVKWSGKVAANETRFVSGSNTNGLVTAGSYTFGADGKMDIPFTGVKAGNDGILYYYKDGKVATGLYNSELVEIDGSVYLVKFSGKVATNETRFIPASNTNGLVDAGTYTFDENGTLVTE